MAGEKNEERAKALQVSYTKATAWLIEEHKEEFDTYRAALLKEMGFEWAPRLTQEQKDALAMAEILARNPGVLDQVLQDGANAEAKASVSAADAHS